MILTIFVIKVKVDMLYIFGNLVTQALLWWWKMSKIVKKFTPSPLKKPKIKMKIFKNLYWSSKTWVSLKKLDRMRGALFVPSLYQESGTFGT